MLCAAGFCRWSWYCGACTIQTLPLTNWDKLGYQPLLLAVLPTYLCHSAGASSSCTAAATAATAAPPATLPACCSCSSCAFRCRFRAARVLRLHAASGVNRDTSRTGSSRTQRRTTYCSSSAKVMCQ